MPTFDPVAMGLERLMQDTYTPSSPETGEASREGTQTGWYKYLGDRKQQQYDMQGNPTRIFENPGLGEQTLDFGKKVAPLALMALTMGGMAGAGPFSGMFGGIEGAMPELLGEAGGYGFTSAELAGSAPTLLGEAGAAGAATSGTGNWLTQAYQSLLGPGTALGGAQGTFGGMGATGQGWLKPLLSIGSGLYGMSQVNSMKNLAQQAISGSAPWTSSGGTAMAGDALKTAISGDLSNDPGYKLAQLGAARTSAQQPGGFAASAAANAAIKYRNETIGALSGPAGVGFNPAAGYQTAISGMSSANDLMSKSLGSIGFGMTGESQGMPPWLQAYLLKNGMGG